MMVILPFLKGINNVVLGFDSDMIQKQLDDCRCCLLESADYKLSTDSVLLDSFHSATIEGARTTIESVKRSIHAPNNKNDKMVVNNLKALERVYSGYKVTDGSMRKLWEIIVDGVCENERLKGLKYRSGEVYIASYDRIVHTPAACGHIEEYMSSMFAFMADSRIDAVLKAIIVHFYFAYIHPYCDGNGRMARILQNYSLYHDGYSGVRKIRISQAINLHLGSYYKTLEQAEKPLVLDKQMVLDITVFIDYMLARITEACHMADKKQDNLTESEKRLLERMSRRGIGAEITVKRAADLLGVSESQAGRILNHLSEKRYLLKTKIEGKNKNLYRLLVLI